MNTNKWCWKIWNSYLDLLDSIDASGSADLSKKLNISESHALEKRGVTWDSQEQSTPRKRLRYIWIKDESKPIFSNAESNKSQMCSTQKSTTSCTSILTTPESATKMKHDSNRLATLQLRLDG